MLRAHSSTLATVEMWVDKMIALFGYLLNSAMEGVCRTRARAVNVGVFLPRAAIEGLPGDPTPALLLKKGRHSSVLRHLSVRGRIESIDPVL